jgi:hypothetical protein
VYVVDHEVQLVRLGVICRVYRHLGWRQAEDQPTMPNVYKRKTKYVAKKATVSFGVPAIDDGVCASDLHHGHSPRAILVPKAKPATSLRWSVEHRG